MRTIPTYCEGCIKTSSVDMDGTHPYLIIIEVCTAYEDPHKKTGADRGYSLGCAFSPKTRETANTVKMVNPLKASKRRAAARAKRR